MNRRGFYGVLALFGAVYLLLIVALVVVDLWATSPEKLGVVFSRPEIRAALWLSLLTATTTTFLSAVVGVPLGYLLARARFWGRGLIAVLVDVPMVLPPIVMGLSLVLLMRSSVGRAIQEVVPFLYAPAGVVLAQVSVCAAYMIRITRTTFEQLSPRSENVALTLGCTPWQAFWRIAIPEARQGLIAGLTLTWARAFGEFGPVLIFAGITRERTEVLPTTIYLELSVGEIETALAVALVMLGVACLVAGSVRWLLREEP
ncbi:MAG: ABC transporter permease [Fimbriiglobus sp.]